MAPAAPPEPRSLPLALGELVELSIASRWDGGPCEPREEVTLRLEVERGALRLSVDAPFHGDPAPEGPACPTPGLWRFEVVELMLLGAAARYLEIELSPHGHYLALMLRGVRRVVRQGMVMPYQATIARGRWQGEARVPTEWLPPACERLNAFAMHGQGAARRHLAWRGGAGEHPDFHRLELFGGFPPARPVHPDRRDMG